MAVALQFVGTTEQNNSKGLIFKATFTGDYGTAGVGDLLNLTPSQNNGTDGGVTDPGFDYDEILEQPPTIYGVLNEALGGSYVNILPNAAPTLKNFGLQMYEPGGAEKGTGVAYSAPELAGSVLLVFYVPLQ